ncbi:exonuclease domain-containing protein [soil metagenome]
MALTKLISNLLPIHLFFKLLNTRSALYAIVDIETTGGHASANGITEIAIYVHDGNEVIKKYKTLINPQQKIPLYITALTGISNAMIAAAPSFDEKAAEIYELLNDQIFIAHNVNFDFSFIKHHLKNCGYDLNVKKLCTVRLSRKVFPGFSSYSLGNVCRELQIPIEDRHRADGDAKATVLLFEKLLMHGANEHIEPMLKRSSSEQWLPMHLEKKEIQQLPALPGVYYFHNVKGKVIYVGKAINIRKRVTSHFTHNDAAKRRQHFLRHVHKITHTVCANELHALVLESTEIKRLWPKYNDSQKQPAQKYGLYCFEDNRGYMRLAIDKKKKHFPALYNFNMLHEGLVLLKNMIDEFELDHKLCYIDKATLTEKDIEFLDPPLRYNGKVKLALDALEKQLPTFAIVDEGLTKEERLYLLIERGSFWGMGYLNAKEKISNLYELKEKILPYTDNDFIRNSIYSYVAAYPEKKRLLL